MLPWLLVFFLAGVIVLLLIDLGNTSAERDKAIAENRVKDAKIARLEGLVRFAGGTMRELVDAHCSCANKETHK